MQPFKLYYEPFPARARRICRGFLVYDCDKMKYYIMIDSGLEPEQKKATLKHELSHPALNHIEQQASGNRSEDDLEDEAAVYAEQMTEEEFSRLMAFQIQ